VIDLSVVMAVHDGADYLNESLDSILGQSVGDFELLVVDDASTDDTPGILAEYARRDRRVRVLRNPTNLGPYPSANRALREACGPVIARHDADDVSPPDRFAVQLAALRSAPNVTLVTGTVERFSSDGRLGLIAPPAEQPALEWELLFSNPIGAGGHTMFPRLIEGLPVLFPALRRYAEDYALWSRLVRLGRVVAPPQVVYRYREHDRSITTAKRAEQEMCAQSIRHENQAAYLPALEPATSDALARFWRLVDERPLGDVVPRLHMALVALRSAFLDDIGARFGASARDEQAAEIDRQVRERLAFWLYRSTAFGDRTACRELAALAVQLGAVTIGIQAVRYGTTALLRKLA